MATHPLNFRNRAETGKTRCAQTVSRLFSARLRKFKAPSRAGTSKAKPTGKQERASRQMVAERRAPGRMRDEVVHSQSMVCFTPALDGALNFCCREEKEGRLV